MNKKTQTTIVSLLTLCMAGLIGLGVVMTLQLRETKQHEQELLDMADQTTALLEEALGTNRPVIEILPEGISEESSSEADSEALSEEAARLVPETDEEAASECFTEEASVPAAENTSEADPESSLIFEEPESEGAPAHTRITDLTCRAIFVGDSRTVGLSRAIDDYGDGCIYIGESGEGYDWFIETGLDLMEDAIAAHPGIPVIFNLGVNDCENISNYIDVYRDLASSQPETAFYYMSVNPVTDESTGVPLSDVLNFNRVLKGVFPDRYIDTCSLLLKNGFVSPDGVHYSDATYCDIHNYAIAWLDQTQHR